MRRTKYFILTEAAAMTPLVRQILLDVREARSRLATLGRRRLRADLNELDCWTIDSEVAAQRRRLKECLAESAELGVEITDGIRCEALFPFEHRWIGPRGDGKIRPAYFVYSDAQETIREWYFSGWPNDRRTCSPAWWSQFRPGVDKRSAVLRAA